MRDTYEINQLKSRIKMLENTLHACEIPVPESNDPNYIIIKENPNTKTHKWFDNISAAERLSENILKEFVREHNLYKLSDHFYKHDILNMNTNIGFTNGIPVSITVVPTDFILDDRISNKVCIDLKINRNNTNDIKWLTHPSYINNNNFSQLPTKRLLINISRVFAQELKFATDHRIDGYSMQDRMHARNIDNDILMSIDVITRQEILLGTKLLIQPIKDHEKLIENNYTITCKNDDYYIIKKRDTKCM